eukprot:3928725-Rhodomonas_salina.1
MSGPSLKNAKSLKATSLDTQKPGAPLSEFGNTFEVLAPNYGRRLLCKVATQTPKPKQTRQEEEWMLANRNAWSRAA